jgi:hypothetical protein
MPDGTIHDSLLEVNAMQTMKRVRSLAFVLAVVAISNYAISLASGVPHLPESPRPTRTSVSSAELGQEAAKSGVPHLPESPRPTRSGVPHLPESPRP